MSKIDVKSLDQSVTQFAKSDNGKLRISLVPTQIVRDCAEVRMYGDQKYHTPNNWVLVDKERYKDALMRHLLAFLDDEDSVDSESGIPHYKHAACNLAFLCEMKRKDWEERKQYMIDHDPKLQEQLEKYVEHAKSLSKDGEKK